MHLLQALAPETGVMWAVERWARAARRVRRQ